MSVRPTFDETFLKIAETIAERSTCTRKKVGAVMARDNRIIGVGYNGSLPSQPHCLDDGCLIVPGMGAGCQRTQHAELNLICFLAKNGISTDNTTLYLTLSPCYSCAKSVIMSGVKRVIYLEDYRDHSGIDLLKENNVEVEYYGK